jgi:hypothetical protein
MCLPSTNRVCQPANPPRTVSHTHTHAHLQLFDSEEEAAAYHLVHRHPDAVASLLQLDTSYAPLVHVQQYVKRLVAPQVGYSAQPHSSSS